MSETAFAREILDLLAPRAVASAQKYSTPTESFILPHTDHALFALPALPSCMHSKCDVEAGAGQHCDAATAPATAVINITVKVLKSTETFKLGMRPEDSGMELRCKVGGLMRLSIKDFRLVRKGRTIADDQTLQEMGFAESVPGEDGSYEVVQLVRKAGVVATSVSSVENGCGNTGTGPRTSNAVLAPLPASAALSEQTNTGVSKLSLLGRKRVLEEDEFWLVLREHLGQMLDSKSDVDIVAQCFQRAAQSLE